MVFRAIFVTCRGGGSTAPLSCREPFTVFFFGFSKPLATAFKHAHNEVRVPDLVENIIQNAFSVFMADSTASALSSRGCECRALAREALPPSFAMAARDVSTLSSASTHDGGAEASWIGGGQVMRKKGWCRRLWYFVRRQTSHHMLDLYRYRYIGLYDIFIYVFDCRYTL